VFCPRCGTENRDTDEVCAECGFSLISPRRDEDSGRRGSDRSRSGEPADGYAGFWRRFAANFIDGIILNIVMVVVGYAVGVPLRSSYGTDMADVSSSRLAVYSVVNLVVGWLYFTLSEASVTQGTLGKRALRIVVTDLDGRRISFGRANARFWSKIISGAIFLIGYIMAGFTARKQALHDMIAGTLVVNRWGR